MSAGDPLLATDIAVLERLPHGQLRIRDARSSEPSAWAFCTAIVAEDLPIIFEAVACKNLSAPERERAMEGFPW